MSDSEHLLDDMARRVFESVATARTFAMLDAGDWPADAWSQIQNSGLAAALVRETDGGLGVDTREACGIVRLAGRHALPLPLAETMLAARFLAAGGIAPVDGVMTFAGDPKTSNLTLSRSGKGWRITGEAGRVPWAARASAIAVVVQTPQAPFVARVPTDAVSMVPGSNIANERRDDAHFDIALDPTDVAELPPSWDPGHIRACGAAIRAIAMAGALEAVLDMTVTYAGEREQFGRPLSRFQAIQQNLAAMAGHVAAAGSAADLAVQAIAEPGAFMPVAVAKSRIGEAAGIVAAIAHQIHGAIGFTREHALNRFTRRLWAWRDEFGGEAEWNRALGRRAAQAGAGSLWPMVTAI